MQIDIVTLCYNSSKIMAKYSKKFTKRDLLMFLSGAVLMNAMSHAWLAYNDIPFHLVFYRLDTNGNWVTALGSLVVVIILVWLAMRTDSSDR